ncbi:hypothetical protein PV-S19_0066 [Pacmanvirus S19]|nr:hypothetical protein PV-S19_0066 [Pacmanvirus S19]
MENQNNIIHEYANSYRRKMADGTIKVYHTKKKYIVKNVNKTNITEELKQSVKQQYELGVPKKTLAERFNLSTYHINVILKN